MRYTRYFRVELDHAELAAKMGITGRYFSELLCRGKLPGQLKGHRVKHGNKWLYDWEMCRPLIIDRLV